MEAQAPTVATKLLLILIISLISCVKSQDCTPHEGVRQSPINVVESEVQYLRPLGFKFSLEYYWRTTFNLDNVGHTFQLSPASDNFNPILSGSLVDGAYTLKQIHFHWRSEHTFNNRTAPMEMHVVHESVTKTRNPKDQFVVIGYVFRVSKYDNPALEKLVHVLDTLSNKGDRVEIYDLALSQLIRTRPLAYYTYEGSLTTEPYTESVKWLIDGETLTISEKQLEAFKEAERRNPRMVNNYRCIQNLNGRTVYKMYYHYPRANVFNFW